jgi:predicted ribosome quality control (RQC) complex YloA/Tae2 family protein
VSLRPDELSALALELTRELGSGVVQKVHAPTTSRIYLEVRVPGHSVTVLVCSEVGVARVSVVEARPPNPATPPTWQSVLRTELTGAKLADVEALSARRTLLFHFTKEGRFLTLVLEATNTPCVVLCTAEAMVRSQSIPSRAGLRVGQPWVPVEEQPIKPQPSRLAGEHVRLRLAHAAEALFAEVEQKGWVDARRAPVVAKLKKLERTIEKVRLEAGRGDKAAHLRREGELLTQNFGALVKGQPSVTLTEYCEDGSTREVTVTLDPKRSPKQEVEHRFHQYKRMLRGAQLAQERVVALERERDDLQARLRALDEGPIEPPPLERRREKVSAQAALPPYREYLGHGHQRIWVGRGSAHNDALTFHVARPFHLWLHVRGLPGAHVVVPLAKGAELSNEVLLDAAHLAAHHSDAKGELKVEVSYTPIKFVHKPKDAGPGAVTYTREKTLLLRLEPARLARLLAAAVEG